MSETGNATTARRHSLAGDIRLIRRNWKLVVSIMAASVFVFALGHLRSSKSYSATASVTFQNSTLSQAGLNIAPSGSSEPQREADTEVYIAHSAEVAEAVRGKVPAVHNQTAEELLNQVKVEAAPTANVLNIIAATSDPKLSAQLANAFAEEYITFVTKAQLEGIDNAQKRLEAQINALPRGRQRQALEESLVRIESLRAVAGGSATVIGHATAPTAPTGNGWSVTLVLGLLVGFAIAFSVVLLRETFSRNVRSVEDFEAAYGSPVLATVPASHRTLLPAAESSLLEPYRILRSALEVASRNGKLDCLLVTSAVPDEGKTTVAVNLARAIALSGRPTVIVEFDLRDAAPLGPYELGARRGLTTVLAGKADLEDVLVTPEPSLPDLRLLPTGTLVDNPSETLRSPGLGLILASLVDEGNTVVIDSAPLNSVADTQGLLAESAIDGVVVVGRLDRTKNEEAAQARAILDRRGVSPIGVVVTHVHDAPRYGEGSTIRTGNVMRTRPSARRGAATGAP